MEMLLMILAASVPVFALCCLMFAGTGPRNLKEKPAPDARLERRAEIPAPRFFAGEPAGRLTDTRFPMETLLSQIERHVRLEQAAAETFLDVPTREALHSRTTSPFMN
jgi:hypothetical protein